MFYSISSIQPINKFNLLDPIQSLTNLILMNIL